MDLNEKVTETKLEEIRVFLSSLSPNKKEKTKQSTLDLVVEHFYDRFYEEIKKANHTDE